MIRDGSRRVLDGDQFRALTEVLSEHPELTADRLRELIRSQDTKQRRSRAEAVRPRTAAEIVQLLEAKVITRAEARRFMRLK